MAKFRAGKTGKTMIGQSTLSNTSWSTTLHADELDVSNFESNGKKAWLIGLQGLDWSMGTLWQATQNPFDDPPGLYMRDDGTNMQLIPKASEANVKWDIPTWMCSNASMEETVAGTVGWNASGKAQDDFTLIAGSAAS